MKNLKNKVFLTGNAGKDPQITSFESGNKVARVSIAVNASYKKEEAWVEKTDWFELVFWNDKATLAESLLVKGTKFSVEGKLSTSSYDVDDQKRTAIEIIVHALQVIPDQQEPS
ncbi:MAG TPA: single-stranded DNA-binding protein [Pedobacter sp.]|nr:single-stranded DNA-binding protein [Pedobacter sp.]